MTTRLPSLCLACRRLRDGNVCEAFPEGIPVSILVYGKDHREPIEGDNGVQFLRGSGEKVQEAFDNWSEFHADS